MIDAPALLPPDPSVPGRYWLSHNGGPSDVWEWSPDARGTGGWIAGDGRICSPEHVGSWGYTLASRHPIPGPAALEAVYAAWEAIQARIAKLEARLESSEMDAGELSGLVRADDLIRAALETKETT